MRMSVDVVTRAERDLSARVIIEISAMIGRKRTNQAALARTIRKSPVWLSDRMTGRARLTVNDLALIADGLGVAIVDLLPSSARRSAMPTAELSQTPARVDALVPVGAAPVAGDLGVATYPLGPLPAPTGQRRATVRTPPGFR